MAWGAAECVAPKSNTDGIFYQKRNTEIKVATPKLAKMTENEKKLFDAFSAGERV